MWIVAYAKEKKLKTLVPKKCPRKKGKTKLDRKRHLLWRKLSKVLKIIALTSYVPKLSHLLQEKWDLELQLRSEYSALNKKDAKLL